MSGDVTAAIERLRDVLDDGIHVGNLFRSVGPGYIRDTHRVLAEVERLRAGLEEALGTTGIQAKALNRLRAGREALTDTVVRLHDESAAWATVEHLQDVLRDQREALHSDETRERTARFLQAAVGGTSVTTDVRDWEMRLWDVMNDRQKAQYFALVDAVLSVLTADPEAKHDHAWVDGTPLTPGASLLYCSCGETKWADPEADQ